MDSILNMSCTNLAIINKHFLCCFSCNISSRYCYKPNHLCAFCVVFALRIVKKPSNFQRLNFTSSLLPLFQYSKLRFATRPLRTIRLREKFINVESGFVSLVLGIFFQICAIIYVLFVIIVVYKFGLRFRLMCF